MPNDFKFPMNPDPTAEVDGNGSSNGTSNNDGPASRQLPKQPPSLTQQAHLAPATRILSSSSVNGSNRSSGEFYANSNNSTDTLDSEYTNYGGNRSKASLAKHRRHYSSLEPAGRKKDFLTLLMGYAQVSASFTVDGSLINQSTFEEVKRKGVVGSQAGGRNKEKPRRSGGLLGAFGWDAIEESISGLLSNGDLEGLRDMRGVTSSNSVPLLSTPQSLLFVDLRLGPGEEKSYSFSFTLPRGLPASHKGKAIKISYNLVIGTQRPSGPKESQQVNRINIPFRVFSGVNSESDCKTI
jgi:RAB6A-GEF complex partner protein 2